MLIPLRHENMSGRRWPIITFALIGLNIAIFLFTHWSIEAEQPKRAEARMHLLLLAATHPELTTTPEAAEFIEHVKKTSGRGWGQVANPSRRVQDTWDAQMRLQEDPAILQSQMDTLCQQFEESEHSSILDHYGFVPAHPHAVSYVTANFLHGGWLHLIGNMWFLWLAGAVLEDTWGRIIYPAFYLIAGVLALLVHGMVNAGSLVPTIGASGAIAGLMGAFLVRFPTTKIEMGWLFLYRIYRFKMQAYWLLPLWLVTEIFYGSMFGAMSGVAHWAHVGGFVFGALIAIGVQKSGLEQMAEQGIQEKISWVSHPLLVTAGDQMEQGKLDEAAASLKKVLAEKPDSVEALRMLQNIYWQKNDLPAHRETLTKLLALEIKANDHEGAAQTCQDFRNAGGEKLPAPLWLEFCRQLENQPDVSHAADEYLQLANSYPAERQGLLAQMAAGRLYLKRLSRPSDALRLYEAAASSSVPHGDWQPTIEKGIADANKALNPQTAPVSPAV